MHHQELSNTETRSVQGELIDDREQSVTSKTLDALSKRLASGGNLISTLLLPTNVRQIALRIQERQADAVAEIAIDRLHSEARKKIVEIDLSAEEQRRRILLRENSRMGARKLQEQQVVVRAILGTIADEQQEQKALQRAELLPEDRQMLSQLFKQRSQNEIVNIAQSHGLNVDQNPSPHSDEISKETAPPRN